MSNDRGGSVILAALAGFVVGAAAGVLLAPASGRETRARVRRAAGRLKDEVGEKSREVGETIGRYSDDLRHAVEAGRKSYREAREKSAVETG